MKQKYIYPDLAGNPKLDFGWFRVGGPGLANCMFVASRAYSLSKRLGLPMFQPSWAKFSIGPYLRREADKRHYFNLFRPLNGGGKNSEKVFLIRKEMTEEAQADHFLHDEHRVLHVVGLGRYFQDLSVEDTQEYFSQVISPSIYKGFDAEDFRQAVAVHVRMGDYSANQRIPLSWYERCIKNIAQLNPSIEFLLFSDGTEQELAPLLALPHVRRVFFGNALADMVAISRTRLVIASDSTFSAWGAYLGQCPIIFNRRHFDALYDTNSMKEFVVADANKIPDNILFEVNRQ